MQPNKAIPGKNNGESLQLSRQPRKTEKGEYITVEPAYRGASTALKSP